MNTSTHNFTAPPDSNTKASEITNESDSKRLHNIKVWLEGLENEDKRKIVSALRRSQEASENTNGSKLKRAQETFGGEHRLMPILIKSERFGKERFSLEFFTNEKIAELQDSDQIWLTPHEAVSLADSIKIERASYPQRLKLAFIYLARRQGIKNYRSFRYSTDGEHYTKAYPNTESVPEAEDTIGFEEAYQVLQEYKKDSDPKEITEIYQTKVFRVAISSLETSEIMAFEKCQPEQSPIPRANYRIDIHPPHSYRSLRRSSTYKLLWPTKQENALFCLMDACQDLILQCSANELGAGNPYYATIYERYAEIGPEGLLYKALITSAEDKKTSSQKATENINHIWQGFNTKAKPLMCLHSKECHWICQLVEALN
jgi:hypothetical protein